MGRFLIQIMKEKPYLRIFLASFSILFLELILIRWIPAYLRMFGFFTNFVLLASLLGSGLGILTHRASRIPLPPLSVVLLALVAFVLNQQYSLKVPTTDVLFYGAGPDASERLWTIPIVFVLVVLAFVPLGRQLGRSLSLLPPLRAYTVDIVGSLAGIVAFVAVAYTAVHPTVWFCLTVIVAWPLTVKASFGSRLLNGSLYAFTLTLVALAGFSGGDSEKTVWSPYYRIVHYPNVQKDGYIISVNNIGHQETRPAHLKEPFYFQAYKRLGTPPFRRVLIIGAGTGTDVVIALANGAEHVDAVEIDPKLHVLGTQLNPEHPYQDPRVTMHIGDGRAFLRHTDQRYDLIVFALTDSLTLTSSQANLRLESFLFTTESMAEAGTHLSDNGLLVLYNYYRQDWSIRKLASMLESAFGRSPYVVTYGATGRAAVLMAGPRLATLPAEYTQPYGEQVPTNTVASNDPLLPQIGAGILAGDPTLTSASDDWPFFYMLRPGVPGMYAMGIVMVLLVATGSIVALTPLPSLRKFDWHFFFLGAAFMLLETRSLVTFALLFGTTWMVNALVFFAILTSVLLSILISARWRFDRVGLLYLILFGLLTLNYVLPGDALLGIDSSAIRYGLAGILTFAPVFTANIVFSRSFRDASEADTAFASNLVGIMVGGLVEYTALAFGYRSLLLPVAAFYAIALLLIRRATGRSPIPMSWHLPFS